ncbi:MAG TPA: hypothetical protein VMN82_01100 [Thermoanaerobaculia bacterium]|nr:hypothetical protein [Thermoanaerobaculia bacterium]
MKARFALATLAAFAFAAALTAETRISGEQHCKAEPPTPVAIPDQPNHSYAIIKATCAWTKPIEIGGSQSKDGSETISAEMWGDKATDRGYYAGTMASGDTYSAKFAGSSRSKDGKPVGGEGTWSFTDGTGKLKGIKGKGTYRGSANADGSITYKIEGEYSLP